MLEWIALVVVVVIVAFLALLNVRGEKVVQLQKPPSPAEPGDYPMPQAAPDMGRSKVLVVGPDNRVAVMASQFADLDMLASHAPEPDPRPVQPLTGRRPRLVQSRKSGLSRKKRKRLKERR